VAETVQRYLANPNVVYAEPDYVVQAIATPTNASFGLQWDMTKIAAPAAWDLQTDPSDVVSEARAESTSSGGLEKGV